MVVAAAAEAVTAVAVAVVVEVVDSADDLRAPTHMAWAVAGGKSLPVPLSSHPVFVFCLSPSPISGPLSTFSFLCAVLVLSVVFDPACWIDMVLLSSLVCIASGAVNQLCKQEFPLQASTVQERDPCDENPSLPFYLHPIAALTTSSTTSQSS